MWSWRSIIHEVSRLQAHRDIQISKFTIIHPENEGFVRSIGDFKGQIADYRKPMMDDSGIHVREFKNHYLVHWDQRDPTLDPIGHLVQDAPHVLLIGGILFLITLGIAFELGEKEVDTGRS